MSRGRSSVTGRLLGTFPSGLLPRKEGFAVAFVSGATGGPLDPIAHIPPIPPIHIYRHPPNPTIPPIAMRDFLGVTYLWGGYLPRSEWRAALNVRVTKR